MEKRKKFFLILFLITVLVSILLAACRQEKNSDKKNQANNPAPVVTESIKENDNNDNYDFLLALFNDSVRTEKVFSKLSGRKDSLFVLVDIKKQRLMVLELGGEYKLHLETKISSGKNNSTPRGEFKISKKRVARVSKKYGGTMTYWNCLTPDERFGIHGLKETSYEAWLGKAASHGCVRIGKAVEKKFYDSVPVGTAVLIF